MSLKILTHSRTKDQNIHSILDLNIVPKSGLEPEADEVKMLVKISEADPSHPGYKHFPQLLHKFAIESVHGSHICLVTEVLCDGSEYFQTLPLEIDDPDAMIGLDAYLPLKVVKELTRQLLRAVLYLHEACGILHGDIKHTHVLFRPKDIDRIAAKELLTNPSTIHPDVGDSPTRLTAPMSQPLPLPFPPTRRTKRKSCHEDGMDTFDWELTLVDMGHSSWTAYHYSEDIQPLAFEHLKSF